MKIGIVGCGKIAQRHLTAYRKMGDLEIVLCDLDKKRAKELAERYGIKWTSNPDEVMGDNGVDAIDVCVPTPNHAKVVLEAIENGKHVFCEKPLTNDLKEAEKIEKKVRESDKVVVVGYLYRFHPAFQKVKEVLEEGVIGKPYHAILRVGGRGSHKAWKHKSKEGGGTVNEMMVHMLDLIIWYFDEIENTEDLTTKTVLNKREIDGKIVEADAEDFALWRLRTKKGVEIICESDLITPSYMNYIEIQGTNGSVWTSILDYFPTVIYCKEASGVYNKGNNFFHFSRVDLFERELNYFIKKIKSGEKPDLNSINDSINILKMINSVD